MGIDLAQIKKFWDNRAGNYNPDNPASTTNLEGNMHLQEQKLTIERNKVFGLVKLTPDMTVLDLGAGVGTWSILFSEKCKEVVAVEYSQKMIDTAKKIARERAITNIEFICRDVLEYSVTQKFDIIFISGLLIYIPDKEIHRLLENIQGYSMPGTTLLLRDSTGVAGKYEIVNKFSETAQDYYNALYRERDEYIEIFEKIGFYLVSDSDVFEENSPLNKWKETKLRVYCFKKERK